MFRIQFQKTVEQVFRIDKEVGNDYWEKALNKQMIKVKVACQWVDGVALDQARLVLVKDLT